MKKWFLILFLFVDTFIFVGGAALGWVWWSMPPGLESEKAELEVPAGASFATVTQKLADAGVVRWPLLFRIYGKLSDKAEKIKSGPYEFHRGLRPEEVLNKLVKGEIRLVSFAIPEGFNMWQIAEKLAEVFPHISPREWKLALKDERLLEDLPSDARTVEGYLFPDTYVIRPKPNAVEVYMAMRKNFDKNFDENILAKGKEIGLNPHQIVTLASIIEKETGKPEERPRIAAVFHNRMKKGMKLQTDPTVIYGIWDRYDGNIRKKDLLQPTAYNTYVIPGLPPGPIASPGRAALEAAVKPTADLDLYFVGRGDGSHHFSTTLKEHNDAVHKYQIKPFRERNRP
jgi:UPF0755 protein